MAKSTKSSPKRLAAKTVAAAESNSSGDLQTYVRFRLLRDSLDAYASLYYQNSKDDKDRAQRLKEIEKLINTLRKLLMGDPRGIGNIGMGCPPGMKDCGGICIPADEECPKVVL